MQKYLKAALIGGGIGFGIGATYAVFFVAYRDSLKEKQEGPGVSGQGVPVITVDEPEEPPAKERVAAAMKERTQRAQEIRAQNPGMTWPDALKHAANGTEPVQEESQNVE